MIKQIKTKYEIKCKNCEKLHSLEGSDLEFECVESHERRMGPENNYEAKVEFPCECETEIEYTFNVWEYPTGVENNRQFVSDTVDVSKWPEIEISSDEPEEV